MAVIKQYVNLDPTKAAQLDGLDKIRAGKTARFEATVTPNKAGVIVNFEITRGDANLFRPGEVKNCVATTDQQGKATLDFVLTENGGDEFTVAASVMTGPKGNKTKAEISSNTYVVWRRIYYQMSRFKAGTPGAGQPQGSLPAVPTLDLADVITELAARNHNIELVDKTGTELIKRYGTVLTSRDSSLDFKLAAKEGYDAGLEPVTVRIILANQIGDTITESSTETDVVSTGKVQFEAGGTLFKDPICAKDQDWLVTAEWKFHDVGNYAPLDARWITRVDDDRMVEVDFTGAAIATGVNAGRNVDVKLTYRRLASAGNGSSWYNVVYLARKIADGTDRSAAEITATAMHEIGHFLNMVPVGQDTHYTGHGHQGRHCFTGLSEGQAQSNDYTAKPGTCIMYGESGLRRLSVFCETCDPSLRKSTAQREGMPKKPSEWV